MSDPPSSMTRYLSRSGSNAKIAQTARSSSIPVYRTPSLATPKRPAGRSQSNQVHSPLTPLPRTPSLSSLTQPLVPCPPIAIGSPTSPALAACYKMSSRNLRMHLDMTTPGCPQKESANLTSHTSESDSFAESAYGDDFPDLTLPKHHRLQMLETFELFNSGFAGDSFDNHVLPLESSTFGSFRPPQSTLSQSMNVPSLSSLCAVINVEGALYYIRKNTIEKAVFSVEDENFRRVSQLAERAEDARQLQAEEGVPSCYTWEAMPSRVPHSLQLKENGSAACLANSSVDACVKGSAAFSEGIHCWHVQCTDIWNTCIGVVSNVGGDSNHSRSGGIPDFLACVKPTAANQFKVHWKGAEGNVLSKAVVLPYDVTRAFKRRRSCEKQFDTAQPIPKKRCEPKSKEKGGKKMDFKRVNFQEFGTVEVESDEEPFLQSLTITSSAVATDHATPGESNTAVCTITTVVNFYHKKVAFFCNDALLADIDFSSSYDVLIGDHTVFAHIKNSATAVLLPRCYKSFEPFLPAAEGIPAPRILAGNPYVCWEARDGQGIEAAFGHAMGLCHWNQRLWVTDRNTIREVDMRGNVTTHYPRLTQGALQGPIQYLGGILAIRAKLYVTDLTNHTVLCVDPVTWTCKPIMNRGDHGFTGHTEEKRAELYKIITEARIATECQKLPFMCSNEVQAAPPPQEAQLSIYMNLAHLPPSWLFVTDADRHCVYLANISGQGQGALKHTPLVLNGSPGEPGRADGVSTESRFKNPTSVISDANNLLLYIADTGNSRLAKVQLVWNELKRVYSGQVTSLQSSMKVQTEEGECEMAVKIRHVMGLALHSETGNCLLATEPASDKLLQVQLQPSLKAIGPTFASPYDHLVMLLKRAKEDAEALPNASIEHCRTLAKAVDLLMSTPNIYQVEYVGGTLDGDVAKFLSDTYASQGVCEKEEGHGSDSESDGEAMSASRRKKEVATAKVGGGFGVDTAPSRVLGLDVPHLDSLAFNVFDVAAVSEDAGGVLVQVAMNIFSKYRFFQKYFGTPELMHRLIQFLSKVQAGYHRENYYHNTIHAADVLQTVHWMINTAGIVPKMSDVDTIAILLAAVVHDYDHPGVNNAFLVNTKDDIALHFNDQSVLENHHLFLTFQLLRVETYSILDMFTDLEQRVIRESMINHVLGTDMKHHFRGLGELKARLQAVKDDPAAIDFMSTTEDKLLMFKSIIHAADISNPTKPKQVSVDWAKRVMKEFREQGKQEEECELPVSPFCDKDADIGRCQKGFSEFVVRPLFSTLVDSYAPLKPMLDNLDTNLAYWKETCDVALPTRPSFKGRRRSVSDD